MRRPAPLLVLVLASIALLPLPGALAHDAAPPDGGPDAASRDFDQIRLTIRVEPDLARGVVGGRMTMAFQPLVEGLRRIHLHCQDTQILAVVGEGADPLVWNLAKGVLRIDLPRPLSKGQGSSVTVAYRSTPKRGP